MAKAAKITIAEVEEIVCLGDIQPDEVHIPGIFVHRIVKGTDYEKRIEVCRLLLYLSMFHFYTKKKIYISLSVQNYITLFII